MHYLENAYVFLIYLKNEQDYLFGTLWLQHRPQIQPILNYLFCPQLNVENKLKYQIKLVGGDVTFGEINVCVNVFGYINENILIRSNAKPGDNIYITGQLGRGRKGLIDWNNDKKSSFVQHYFCPKINFDKSRYISGLASSCIDISDGLMKDLGSICKLSKVGAKIFYEDIPITNDIDDLSYGDDYELCFTSPKIYKENFNKEDFSLIGEITPGKNIELIKDNKLVSLKKNGWESFD